MAFFQALGASLGGRVADRVFPADSKESGGSLGQGAKDYYDAAFPGTNPWERLGAGNPQGQVEVAHQQQKQKNKELHTASQTQTNVAKIHAQAQVKAAEISANPGERQASVAEAKAPIEIQRLGAEIGKTLAETLKIPVESEHLQQQITNLVAELPKIIADTKAANSNANYHDVLADILPWVKGAGIAVGTLSGGGMLYKIFQGWRKRDTIKKMIEIELKKSGVISHTARGTPPLTP